MPSPKSFQWVEGLGANESRPARATARAAAAWIATGWFTASRSGTISSARSGRPRDTTSRATSRSATGWLETASARAAGQSVASRSSCGFSSGDGVAIRA